MIIRGPLGALGALMVFLEGIAAGALAVLGNEPNLQRYLVIMIIGTVSFVTILVGFVISYFALTNPGLLFNPQDIDPSAHPSLYVKATPRTSTTISLSLQKPGGGESD